MSNVKRDSYTQIPSGERKSTGNEIIERRVAYLQYQRLLRQREKDKAVLASFAAKAPRPESSNNYTQQRDGIRLDAPYQGPTGLSRDSIDLSSVVGKSSVPSGGNKQVSLKQWLGQFAPSHRPSDSNEPASSGGSVVLSDRLSSSSAIHDSAVVSYGMSGRQAFKNKLDKIYCGIPSYAASSLSLSNIGTVQGTPVTLANWARVNFTNFAYTTLGQINPTTNLSPNLWKSGYLGSINPFESPSPNFRLIGWNFPNAVAPANNSGTYLIFLTFMCSLTVAQTCDFLIEEDESAVTIGSQPALKTYAMFRATVTTSFCQLSANFLWRNLGTSDGLRLLVRPQGGNDTFSIYGPQIVIQKIDE